MTTSHVTCLLYLCTAVEVIKITFAVLYVSLNNGPYALKLQFFAFIFAVFLTQSIADRDKNISGFENKRPPCWNCTSGFDFGPIVGSSMSLWIGLSNFIERGPLSAEL